MAMNDSYTDSNAYKTTQASTIAPDEVASFNALADTWWDPYGSMRPLHAMNPARIGWIKQQLMAHFGKVSGLRVLDVGCGGGLVCEPLARLGATVCGLDAAEDTIRAARTHAQAMGLDITYIHGSAEHHATEPDADAYDVVIALEMVEHVADVSLLMQHLRRLVRDDGLVILSTLNRSALSFVTAIVGAEYIARILPRGTHDWRLFLTPGELAAHARNHQLGVREQTGLCFKPLRREWVTDNQDMRINYLMSFCPTDVHTTLPTYSSQDE